MYTINYSSLYVTDVINCVARIIIYLNIRGTACQTWSFPSVNVHPFLIKKKHQKNKNVRLEAEPHESSGDQVIFNVISDTNTAGGSYMYVVVALCWVGC